MKDTVEKQQTVIAQLEAAKAGGKKIVRSSGEGDERPYLPDEDDASASGGGSGADEQQNAADPGEEADEQSSGSTPSGATLDTGNLYAQNGSDSASDPEPGSRDTQSGDGPDRAVLDDSIPAPSTGEVPDRSSDMPNTGIN